MALLESTSIQIGTQMPDFSLPDPENVTWTIDSLMGEKGLLIAFTCNHCPYAIAIWDRLIGVANEGERLGISSVAINPNIHPDYPEDAPDKMIQKISEWKIPFPYLIDDSQSVAIDYHAQCTPDIYLLDASKKLVYHGRLDDNWQNPNQVTTQDLKNAITCLANGDPISERQLPTLGCSIKWK
jgi:peroxiredoxin